MDDERELTVLFRKEVKVITLRYEYPGYQGEEKYALITSLTKEELFDRYGSFIQRFVPFILLDLNQGEAIYAAHRNDDKFRKRLSRGDQIYLEEITESAYGLYLEDDFIRQQNEKEKKRKMYPNEFTCQRGTANGKKAPETEWSQIMYNNRRIHRLCIS